MHIRSLAALRRFTLFCLGMDIATEILIRNWFMWMISIAFIGVIGAELFRPFTSCSPR